jgi:hypothetical protein
MNDIVFRSNQTVQQPIKNENVVGPEVQTERIHEQVPYTEYRSKNGKPFMADYYNLGDNWEVFNKEITTIEDYLQVRIENGELANDIDTIKKEIKKMEKLHNLKDEPRAVIKIGTIASYVDFLNDTEGIKMNWGKYGH